MDLRAEPQQDRVAELPPAKRLHLRDLLYSRRGHAILLSLSLFCSAMLLVGTFLEFGWDAPSYLVFLQNIVPLIVLLLCSPFSVLLDPSLFQGVSPERSLRAGQQLPQGLLDKIDLRKWPCPGGAVFLLTCMLANAVLCSLRYTTENPLVATFWVSSLVALCFPATGAAGFLLGKQLLLEPSKALTDKQRRAPVARVKNKISQSARGFLTEGYPYLSSRFGYASFCILVSFLPNGLGLAFANWLLACAWHANMTSALVVDPGLGFLVCTITAACLARAFDPISVRLSAGYQALLRSLFMMNAGDSILDAFHRAIDAPVTRIELPSRHPHLRSAWESLAYICSCYVVLFSLVAFCRFPAIINWLNASLFDAGFDLDLWLHVNLQFFFASIVAAFGTAPVAVMSCSFVPPRKAPTLLVSEQGLLFPERTALPKLHFWSNLRKVSVSRPGTDQETLKLQFRGETIKLKTKDVDRENLARVLAAADEYSLTCTFDANAVNLREQLCEHTASTSLADGKKFESTIFRPHKPGRLLKQGAYRVVRKLASKPMNAVYLTRTATGELAILKQFVIPQNNKSTHRQKELFQREYELLRGLSHPLIARVIETFEEGGDSYIAIEHIRGIDLRDLVEQRGPRTESIVSKWAVDICSQLKYLHNQDPPVLHRDVTPDNFVLDEHGHVRMIDFGAAHQFMEGVTGTLIGKQAYIAPEQLRGKPRIQSDIYGLGAMLHFLLTGTDPPALKQCDPSETGVAASTKFSKLIHDCTAYEPGERPASIDQVLNVLDASCIDGARHSPPSIQSPAASDNSE